MVKMSTLRGLIVVAVKRGCDIFQLNVNNTFFHRDLNEEVFMEIPPRLMVPKLGLKEWDIFGVFSSDLGRLHYFLGLEILYKNDGIIISQIKFVIDLLKEYVYLSCSPLSSPLDPSVKLKAKEEAPLSDPSCYRKLVRKLNFLTNTRLDITFSVQHLSQFMQDPREPHLKAAYHLLRYLKTNPSLGIFFSTDNDDMVKAYRDSDWAFCPDSRKSVTSYIVLLGNSHISWKSKKHETISLSSTEAEYRSIRKVVGELMWLQRLLEELTFPFYSPIVVFCDS
ncbi:uncharacterized mitochondrial protein AtMg00810-like [Nicotiana sylvestris]|uniref:uncharacterized mitochondrial protein AtMg00810-like n=1 Tax=Nicotiana sylvestris TaxID=4096 RepID=UPI00388C9318